MKKQSENSPIIQFLYDKDRIRREVDEMAELEGSIKEIDTTFYFPFSERDLGLEGKILVQIRRDENACNAHDFFVEVEKEWKKREAMVLEKLQRCDSGTFRWQPVYQIFATLYGTTGYFYEPDQVCVRLFEVDQETVLETILHELIHLLIEHKIRHASYEEREKEVDAIVVRSGLLEEFSKYHIQKFSS